jgi:transcriptional regulator with GAF, ATPase, and Fis domain
MSPDVLKRFEFGAELHTPSGARPMLGNSPAFRQVLAQAARVAATDATVLIYGETGTGKGLLARAIHAHSARRDRPLIVVNCAALPASLIESELFGHEKGAFTGATQRKPGRFELANGATLFLDEVGELPPETQAKFLRALQDGVFEPLGSTRTLRVDVRVLAASNRPLETLVAAGKFRPDLFYRLNVMPLTLPPLRERRSDILPLAEYFLRQFQERFHKPTAVLSPASRERLLAYHWPGNVRELEHVIERAVLLADGGLVTIDLPAGPAPSPAPAEGPLRSLAEVQRDHIERVLRHTGGVIEGNHGAAAILQLNASTLRSLLKRLGLR